MFRWLLFLVAMVVAVAVGVNYLAAYLGYTRDGDDTAATSSGDGQTPVGRTSDPGSSSDKDDQSPGITVLASQSEVGGGRVMPVVVIPDARFNPKDKEDVPSERDGRLLVIGTEVAPGEQVPAERRYTATLGYVLVPLGPNDRVPPDQIYQAERGAWRRLQDGEVPPADSKSIYLHRVTKEYKRLEVNDEVKAGQTVALVDPVLALNDLAIKVSALKAAESERRASQKTKEEAERRMMAMAESNRKVPGSVSRDDYQGAVLTYHRYCEEEVAKTSAVDKAQQELIQAQTITTKHEIRTTIPGVVKTIYKNRGEAVKTLEPVLQVQSRDLLRVEGNVDVQDTYRIKPGVTEVLVEPTQLVQQRLVLEGHLGEVTGVAVGRGPDPVVVSGSEDRTVRGWSAATGQQLWLLRHRSPVKSVACTGPRAKRGLALAGYGDGSAAVIDLDRLHDFIKGKTKEQPAARELARRHTGAVRCVAFSPDGTVCATGGDDRMIYLWDTETGKCLYELPFHRGSVTSLQFTPRNQLVSAAGDNLIAVWSVEPGRPPVKVAEFPQRGGEVTRVGASPDGRYVLFDQGKEIRLLSIESGQVEGVFRNASGTANFSTLALFDPDGLTVLTNRADNRMQLWRAPTHQSARAAELRQLVWASGAATSAAFSPDGTFCVTGMKDRHVLVWPMPERHRDAAGRAELVETPVKTRIKEVGKFIDSSNRQVPVWAEVENKDNRLVPGGTATMVVLPEGR